MITQAIESIGKNHTVIVITHQLDLIRNFDQIAVMNSGKIAGTGTYDELMKTGEEFKKMKEAQTA